MGVGKKQSIHCVELVTIVKGVCHTQALCMGVNTVFTKRPHITKENSGERDTETEEDGRKQRKEMFANHRKKGKKKKERKKSETKRKSQRKKRKRGRKKGRMSEQGFSSAVGVKENATNNEMSILPTSSLSLSLLRLFSSGPHYQCT